MGGKKKRSHQSHTPATGKKHKQSGTQSKGKDVAGDGATGHGRGTTINLVKHCSHPYPIPGLSNLGNTCFFNAVMQNLSQTHFLRQRMAFHLSQEEYPLELPSGREYLPSRHIVVRKEKEKADSFAIDFYQFLTNMKGLSSRTLNPRVVFSHVCKNAPRFSSYQQQDSHELLRYLLDSLKSEEIKRIKRAILESYGIKGKAAEKGDTIKTLDENEKKEIKIYGIQAAMVDTYIDDVFGGKLASSITCLQCKTRSDMQEDLLDLSLPVPPEKIQSTSRYCKNKRKHVNKSSDEDEGIGQGEGIRKKKLEASPKLSKNQRKKQEKEKRKAKSQKGRKGKAKFAFKESSKEDESQRQPMALEIHPQREPPQQEAFLHSTSESNMDINNKDGNLADDEGVFSTQVLDSDNSAHNDTKVDELTRRFSKSLNIAENTDINISESIIDNYSQTISTPDVAEHKEDAPASVAEHKEDVPASVAEHKEDVPASVAEHKEDVPASVEDDSYMNECTPQTEHTENVSPTVSVTAVDDSLQNIGENTLSLDADTTALINSSDVTFDQVDLGKEENLDVAESTKKNTKTMFNPAVMKELVTYVDDYTVETDEDEYTLEYCLKMFASPEHLTGSEKFYCDVCTDRAKKKREEKIKDNDIPQEETDGGPLSLAQLSKDAMQRTDTHSVDKSMEGGVHTGLEEDVVGTEETHCPLLRKESSSSSSSGLERDDEKDHTESTKESDDVEESVKDDEGFNDSDGELVFCEATKQLMIDLPPPVLCIQLKRFTQLGRSGRNLRKNNVHIQFKTILDLAPYCTDNCQNLYDSNGQLLYSLYGVVVHGGSMHGGHYVAYVRVRMEFELCDISPKLKANSNAETSNSYTTSLSNETERIKDEQLETSPSINSTCSQSSTFMSINDMVGDRENVETTVAKEEEEPDVEKDDETNEQKGIFTVKEESDSEDDVKPKMSLQNLDASSSSSREFDLSSTENSQWYYISDTHVMKASQDDVLQCQAYLLFYERLPFKK